MKYKAPRGTKDILPGEAYLWQLVEGVCRDIFENYNYREIRTPIFEATELFSRSIGGTTDIVKKEMYTFADKKGRSLTLRPEATAAVVRAALENNLLQSDSLLKVYYFGPMFRYERPQAGRQRQFHQAGVEVFGSADPLTDAEVIQLNVRLFEALGLKELEVRLNIVGCAACQPGIKKAITEHFRKNIKEMCADCQERLVVNPLRILDCKEEKCQKYLEASPVIIEHICLDCRLHFKGVKNWLDAFGVKYQVNDRLVRGLDYYTKTAFEIVSKKLGAQNAVCGGGRYDRLVEELGGRPTPAIGFAVGLERLIEILKQSGVKSWEAGVDLFIATIGDQARRVGARLVMEARAIGLIAEFDHLNRSLKAQMKAADRAKADFAYIIGDEELKKGAAVLRNMKTSTEKMIKFSELLSTLTESQEEDPCSCH